MDEAALWASAVGSVGKISAALWGAQLILGKLDQRRLSLSWKILLAVATIATGLSAIFVSGTPAIVQKAWAALGALGLILVILRIDQWRRTSSTQVHEELKSDAELPDTSKKKGKKRAVSPDPFAVQSGPTGWDWSDGIALVGLIGSLGIVMWDVMRIDSLSQTARGCAAAYSLSSIWLLSTSVVLALETTFGGIGAGLLSLNWSRIRYETAFAWCIAMVTAACELSLGKSAGEWEEQLGPIMFCVGLLVVGYILFAAAQRLAHLKQAGKLEGLPSLALAAWLAVLSLVVVMGLPVTWPWQNIP
ncbi:MAG: hypothetical protein U0892_17570 [Pirellulales bacterium]